MSRRFHPRHRRADSNNGEADWQAKWIWCEGEPSPKNFYLHARRVFELKTDPERAVVRCTADSRYELYVNGRYVGRGPVRCDPRYQSYDTHDVTSLLAQGKNSIALLVHHYGDSTYSYVLGRGGLICQVDVEAGGETTVIGTDEQWKVLPVGPWLSEGAKMSRRLGYQEVYDARLDLGAWSAVRYDDRKWTSPKVLGAPPVPPWENLIPRTVPHLREEQVYPSAVIASAALPPDSPELRPEDVPALMASEEFVPLKKRDITGEAEISVPGGHGIGLKGARSGGKTLLVDFGREVSGRVRIDLTGYAGGTLDIGYSEKLENGRINPGRSEVLYSDRLTMRAGRYTWTTFESRGFRYMQLDFRNIKHPVHLHSVSVVETLYPAELKGSFESSDEMLNRIWSVGAETARLCMEDSFVDCPWRERGEWWADARIESHVAYYAFGDTALFAQGLRNIARTQRRDGAVMCMYPVPGTKIVPDFAALWILSVWEYYALTNDRGTLFDLYPAITRLLGWFSKFLDEDGLLANIEGWSFIDWADLGAEGEVTALNCFYYKALRRAEHIALVLGKGADADRWNGMASILRIAINKHLWSPSRGLYVDNRENGKVKDKFSRQTNVLAVLFDVPDHYRKSSIIRQMQNNGLPDITTPYFMGYFTDALFKMGSVEEALDVIRKRWGAMIEAGATTFWEHFSDSDSLCHGWSSSPTRDLSAYVLGVQPVPGRRRVHIEPLAGNLKWAKGVVPTVFGQVEIEWRKNRRDLTLNIGIPSGLSAALELPMAGGNARITINGKDREGTSFDLGPGHYDVRVRPEPVQNRRKQTILDRNARETLVEYLSGHQIWRTQERRIRRKARSSVAEAEVEEEEDLITDDEIEYVEGFDEIRPTDLVTTEQLERRKPGRSRRRRSKAQVEVESTNTAESDAPSAPQESETAEAQPFAEAAVEEPSKRRPRRSRRGRGRSRGTEEPKTEAVETKESPETAAVEQPTEPSEELVSNSSETATGHRSRRPRRRSRKRPQPADVPESSPEATGEPDVSPSVESLPKPEWMPVARPAPVETETPVEEPVKPRRRSRRRKTAAPVESKSQPEIQQTETATSIESPTREQPVEAPQEAGGTPAPRPRRRRQTRKSPKTPAADESAVSAADSAPTANVPAAAPAETPAEEAKAAPRKRRSYRRRRSSSSDLEDSRLSEE